MPDDTHPELVVGPRDGPPPGPEHALHAAAVPESAPDPGSWPVGAALPKHVQRMVAALAHEDTATVTALFPAAHDWQWRADTLEVLHARGGSPVRDLWYRRGDRLFLESRVVVER